MPDTSSAPHFRDHEIRGASVKDDSIVDRWSAERDTDPIEVEYSEIAKDRIMTGADMRKNKTRDRRESEEKEEEETRRRRRKRTRSPEGHSEEKGETDRLKRKIDVRNPTSAMVACWNLLVVLVLLFGLHG